MRATGELDDCLAGLSPLGPDASRAARTRERCRATLQRRARPAASPAFESEAGAAARQAVTGLAFRKAAATAVSILCVVYVVSFIATTVGLQGMMR
jgi:hypothetical protein